jgi:hypothetical protein
MTFRSRLGWLLVHIAPFVVVPLLASAAADFTAEATGVICYTALMLLLVVGQAMTVTHRRWALFTTLGLVAAFVAGGALITVLDPVLHLPESVIIPIAHAGCGLVLGAVQSRALPSGRIRWTLASAAVWLVAAAIVFPLMTADWMPGNVRGLFPGGAEMTTLLRLLPIYAAMMLIRQNARAKP